MCDFFSAIVTRDHRVLFTEEDSHETIIARAGLTDTLLHGRAWVRVELRPTAEGWGPLVVEETTTPGWWDTVTDGDRVRVVADRVRAAWAPFVAARAAGQATFETTCATAWAPYEAARAAALAPFETARAAAWAPYDAAAVAAWATYDAACVAAWATSEVTRAAALATYETVIRTMDGYVPGERTRAS